MVREVHQVPKVPNLVHNEIYYEAFGFSPIVNDYKIVRLSISSVEDDRVYLVQVFSVSTRSWKEVEVGKLKGIMPDVLTCGFTFDGAISWIGLNLQPSGGWQEGCLISLDIATESFSLMPIPRSAHVTDWAILTTYENKLAMLSTKTSVEYKSWIESTKSFFINFPINLWVMEKCVDTSGERWIWTKIYTSNPFPDRASSFYPRTIWRNGIVGVTNKHVVLRNLHTNEFKMLAMGKYSTRTLIWNSAESLVSVDNIHIEASSS